jgi:hypothetical protein
MRSPGTIRCPPSPSPRDRPRISYQTLKTGIAAIRGDMDQILAGPGTPTPAQTGQALKLTATDLKKMLTGLDVLLDDMEIMVRRLYIPAAPPTAP